MADDDGLIREINEDVRREKFQQFWKNFGKYIFTISFAIVVATICFVLWRNYNETKLENLTSSLIEAQDLIKTEKLSQANQILDEISTANSDFANLTDILKQNNDNSPANLSDPYQNIANLFNDIEPSKQQNQQDEEQLYGSFLPFAQEKLAFNLLKQGKQEEALNIFKQLSVNLETPRGVRKRAETIIRNIKNM